MRASDLLSPRGTAVCCQSPDTAPSSTCCISSRRGPVGAAGSLPFPSGLSGPPHTRKPSWREAGARWRCPSARPSAWVFLERCLLGGERDFWSLGLQWNPWGAAWLSTGGKEGAVPLSPATRSQACLSDRPVPHAIADRSFRGGPATRDRKGSAWPTQPLTLPRLLEAGVAVASLSPRNPRDFPGPD